MFNVIVLLLLGGGRLGRFVIFWEFSTCNRMIFQFGMFISLEMNFYLIFEYIISLSLT